MIGQVYRGKLNDYLTVKMNMPPLASVDLHPAVVRFMRKKSRQPQQNFNMQTFKKHEYFYGFFSEATEPHFHFKMNLKPKF